ncbi:hypothetical protein ACVOMV_08315 [Mesorhizobium atlanticum]
MAGDPKASAQIQADNEDDVAGEYLEAETVLEDAQAAADEILEAPEVPDSSPTANRMFRARPGSSRRRSPRRYRGANSASAAWCASTT